MVATKDVSAPRSSPSSSCWSAFAIARSTRPVLTRKRTITRRRRPGRQTLTVAFIPVTCHLTCPVTDYASKTSTTGTEFDAMRFGEFPSIVEALKTKKLLAGFITVPLAMKMREQGRRSASAAWGIGTDPS